MNNISLFEAARLLLHYDNYGILIHRRPDGDAIGSAEGLRLILSALGKKAAILSTDELPSYLRFVPGAGTEKMPEGQKTFVAVDVAESSLLGTFKPLLEGKILLKLDHHCTGEDFARFNYTDETAAAAGEIIYELAGMTETLNKDIAAALYVAIASDTGWFRYSNTTCRTLEIAAELYKAGIDAAFLNSRLFESKELKTVQATAVGVEHTLFLHEGQAAFLCFTAEMQEQGGFSEENLAELSSALREIESVELTAVLKQSRENPEKFKLSTRSKSFFDCSVLCGCFEGGGHLRASGGTVYALSPEEALGKVVAKTEELWN